MWTDGKWQRNNMTPKDIENLRLLANNTEHLILMVMTRLKREADERGHDMSEPYWAGANIGNHYKLTRQVWDMYCRKCVYEIDLDCATTKLGIDDIRIKHSGGGQKCLGK
jgi:hypothetical protein